MLRQPSLYVLLTIFLLIPLTSMAASDTPEWIWCEADREAGTSAFFRKEFSADKQVASAVIRAVGESASLNIFLDGVLIAEVDAYDPLLRRDITDQFRTGKHAIATQSTSCGGPAAFFLQLDLTFDDNSRRTVVTDTTWMSSKTPARAWNSLSFTPNDWQRATSFGEVSERLLIAPERQVGITAVDNYEQWKQALGVKKGTDPAAFLLTPGFEIELVRSAQPDEDSWVSLAFDPQGRAVIAKEKKGLLRMNLSTDGGRVTFATKINDTLEECRGVLFAFGDLFVNANNSKGLYRLPASGNDGFGKPQLLYASSGGVGHGRNDLALGPDKKIYMIHGDSVDLPEKCVDYTSPLRDTRNGDRAGEGHLLRIDPKGGEVEVLAAGLRNPFGIDFNSDGEVFTYDADAEYDMGSPWYRPTRVSHLVTGGDHGWRAVTKSWPPYYTDHPDNALPNLDIGRGSPTAVKFGTRSKFPKKYREALFILDWAYGRILAVHPTPRGSSYLLTAETFLKGRPLNVTDLDFGPDGSMYFVTGGRGTQSALYRIRYVGKDRSSNETQTRQQAARKNFAWQSRHVRRELESHLRKQGDDGTLADVWQHLSDADPRIRHAARNVLERLPVDKWQGTALAEKNTTAAVTALLALARSNNQELRPRIIARLNKIDWAQSTKSNKLTALYTYWLCLTEDADYDSRLLSAVAARLDALYPNRLYSANRLLSELLVRLEVEDSVSKTIELLKSTTDQTEQMHYLFVLRNMSKDWTLDQRKVYFEALARTKHYLGGAGMPDFVKRIREEATATLSESEREALGRLVDDPLSATIVQETPPRPFVRKWTVEALAEALNSAGSRRDLARGEAMFAAASCSKCHRIGGKGTLVGPDLTSASSRFSRRDLLQSIITPSKVVPEKYRSLQIVTASGRTYLGQTVPGGDFRSTSLRLATDPLHPGRYVVIRKSEIEVQRHSPVSWMPDGLLDTLNKEEVLDLLAYIEARGLAPK
jgi:putative heme-binding domain-containing protein